MIGITFEEKVLNNISLKGYLNLIDELSLDFLELAPDFNQYSIEFYKELVQWCYNKNLELHFHHPHFIDDDFRLENFNKNTSKKVEDYLNAVSKLLNGSISNYVIHGAKIKNTRLQAIKTTQSFINFFIHKKAENQWSLKLSIETLYSPDKKIIGTNRKELLNLIKNYSKKHIGICLDLTHDYRNFEKYEWPSKDFLKRVNHFHIHGYSDDKDHIGLEENPELIKLLSNIHKKKPLVNYELLFIDNYIEILKKDTPLLRKAIL